MLGLIEMTPTHGELHAACADDSTLSGWFAGWCREDWRGEFVHRDEWSGDDATTANAWSLTADLDSLASDLEMAALRVETAILVSRSCR
jgi:hypothetical protein